MADQETRLAAVQLAVDLHRESFGSVEQISDGYHTFAELYEHRITLFIALARQLAETYTTPNMINPYGSSPVWRSTLHSDGSVWNGWFLLGIEKAAGMQITYHLPMSEWEECSFAETLEKAPPFDGHTSQDVLNRLKNL